jgi:hypothetical protein
VLTSPCRFAHNFMRQFPFFQLWPDGVQHQLARVLLTEVLGGCTAAIEVSPSSPVHPTRRALICLGPMYVRLKQPLSCLGFVLPTVHTLTPPAFSTGQGASRNCHQPRVPSAPRLLCDHWEGKRDVEGGGER